MQPCPNPKPLNKM